MPNVFGIADDILVIGYDNDGKDHDKAVYNVLKQCWGVNLKLNKDKCHFRCTLIPFFGEIISKDGVWPDPRKVKALTKMPPPNNKKELQAFLGIIYYLGKFSPDMARLCDPLRKLTSCKSAWTWNESYQQIYNKAKSIIKKDMCMKFYKENKELFLEKDASGVGLGSSITSTNRQALHGNKGKYQTTPCYGQ